jgi:hypothetical protein
LPREAASPSTLAGVSDLWLPGAPSVDEFVTRVHQQIGHFTETHGLQKALVEVHLRDGSRYLLDTISAEPGHGFVTLRPHPEDEGEREELIVPLASVTQIRIAPTAAAEPQFGFALPES